MVWKWLYQAKGGAKHYSGKAEFETLTNQTFMHRFHLACNLKSQMESTEKSILLLLGLSATVLIVKRKFLHTASQSLLIRKTEVCMT